MHYNEAINVYAGRDLTPFIDYLLQDDSDGNGIYFKFWNVSDILQPTMEQLNTICAEIVPMIEFEALRETISDEQIKAQKKPILFINKFTLDCSDDTYDLIYKAKKALETTNRASIKLIDYTGVYGTLNLEEINSLLIELYNRRLDLHDQEMDILNKVLTSQPYEVIFI